MGGYGERVLGFAQKKFTPEEIPDEWDPDKLKLPPKDLVFVGLISLIDPPKAGVAEAVKKCRSAGIRFLLLPFFSPFQKIILFHFFF